MYSKNVNLFIEKLLIKHWENVKNVYKKTHFSKTCIKKQRKTSSVHGSQCMARSLRRLYRWVGHGLELTELVADDEPHPRRPRVQRLGAGRRHAPAPLLADPVLRRARCRGREGEAEEPCQTARTRHVWKISE